MSLRKITATELHAALVDGDEIALIDVRNQRAYGMAHILRASHLALCHLEIGLHDLVPRLGTNLVFCDAGEGLAGRAAKAATKVGYRNAAVLEGGTPAWSALGYELFSGLNVPSKAFGEFVEHRYGTPNIAPEDLKAKLSAGENLIVLDSRPFEEFQEMSIPGGIDTPGAELVYRARDLAPDPATLVVVNCAGRTRSIIGCQSLVNAGLPNPVVALRDGTMGWHLAGQTLDAGADDRAGPPSEEARAWACKAALQARERMSVDEVSSDVLEAWQKGTEDRTLYLFDVRQPEEFLAGHLPGARSAPGGQLVQASDSYMAVREARVVLTDDSGARADMTASWLKQLGYPEVYVYRPGSLAEFCEIGAPSPASPFPMPEVAWISPSELKEIEGQVAIFDLADSVAHLKGHVPGARLVSRENLRASIEALEPGERFVVTCPDGRLSPYAAAEAASSGTFCLAGGTAAWVAAGLPLEAGKVESPSAYDDLFERPFELESDPEQAMRDYLTWEVQLVEQLKRDKTLKFMDFFDQ